MAERRRRPGGWGQVFWGDAPPAPAVALYALLLPMAVLVAIAVAGGLGGFDAGRAVDALRWLGAVILAFLAGARFGRGLAGSSRRVVLAAIPPLAGWAALLLPAGPGLLVLGLAHAAQGVWDVWSADGIRLPAWYGGLRARTTPIAVVLLVAGFFAGG
ncbi:MAG: DUF3429 family protein [Bauldia sp.]|nr:DUF3429 family protein [Bauldia sp.]